MDPEWGLNLGPPGLEALPSDICRLLEFIFNFFLLFREKVRFYSFWNGSHASPHQRGMVFTKNQTIELLATPYNCRFSIFLFIKKQINRKLVSISDYGHCLAETLLK